MCPYTFVFVIIKPWKRLHIYNSCLCSYTNIGYVYSICWSCHQLHRLWHWKGIENFPILSLLVSSSHGKLLNFVFVHGNLRLTDAILKTPGVNERIVRDYLQGMLGHTLDDNQKIFCLSWALAFREINCWRCEKLLFVSLDQHCPGVVLTKHNVQFFAWISYSNKIVSSTPSLMIKFNLLLLFSVFISERNDECHEYNG